MISSITGKVLETRVDGLVINLSGFGMFVLCSPDLISQAKVGQEISIHTTLVVREDSLTLFGFENVASKDLFELVQSVSGFGPKLAFTILASMSADEFKAAIANEDLPKLKSISGVGTKGGQRLILELKDRIGEINGISSERIYSNAWQQQVEQALINLGWSTKDANLAISQVMAKVAETPGKDVESVSDLLKRALRVLAK